MNSMTREEQISRIQDERDDARQDLQDDLRDALTEVNAKVGRAEDDLRPDRMIENHAVGAALIAGALGFLLGSSSKSGGVGPVVIAALFGFALSRRGVESIEPETNLEEP
jgi:hypothetical protein